MADNNKFLSEFFKLSGIKGRNHEWKNDRAEETEPQELSEDQKALRDEFHEIDDRIAAILHRGY